MLLLGGGDEEQQLADAWSLDVGTSAWTPLPAAVLPSARSWHSAHMLLRDQVCPLPPTLHPPVACPPYNVADLKLDWAVPIHMQRHEVKPCNVDELVTPVSSNLATFKLYVMQGGRTTAVQ